MKGENEKCNGGKCGKANKDMRKEINATKPAAEKTAPAKGKCGVGKCS